MKQPPDGVTRAAANDPVKFVAQRMDGMLVISIARIDDVSKKFRSRVQFGIQNPSLLSREAPAYARLLLIVKSINHRVNLRSTTLSARRGRYGMPNYCDGESTNCVTCEDRLCSVF